MHGASESRDGPRPDLLRGIRRWDLVAVAINGIIGAGIFGLPARTFALIGTYSLFAFGACAMVVALIILCFAEVGSRYGESGGPYLYARDAFGPVIGFQVGWLQWLARTTAFAANLNLLCVYLSTFWPRAAEGLGRAVIMVVVASSLTLVNILGVRRAARLSNVFTIGKLLPLAFFIVAGLFFLEPQRYALGAAPGVGVFSQTVLLLIFAFTGFEMAAIPAGEVDDPRKNLPRALLLALGIITLFYMLIQVVCVGTLPGLAASTRPLADASGRFLGRAGTTVILVGAVISITGNLNVLILSGSRLPYAMATRNELPKALATVHPRYRTPHAAILLTAAVMLTLALSGTFLTALTISAISRLLSYAATCAALPVLRKKPGAPAALFTAPGGPAIALAALVLSAWLLSHSSAAEAQNTAIASAVGLAVYLGYRVARARESKARG